MIVNLNTISAVVPVWKQERLVLRGTGQSFSDPVNMYTDLHGSSSSPIGTYESDANDVLIIDMTDYVRTYPSVQHVYLENSGYSKDVQLRVEGLINPQSVIVPTHELMSDGVIIAPPSKIIVSGVGSAVQEPTRIEFYATTIGWGVAYATISANSRRIYNVGGWRPSFDLKDANDDVVKTYVYERMQSCSRYALVKWVSFTGIERVSWFEVQKPKSSVKDAYQLQPIDNEYIEIKGREDGFALFLDGLDAYDLWYYADVLLSSNVEISLDGGTTFDRVRVVTSEIETPDFVPNGKLEITVNWKRYDAVSM